MKLKRFTARHFQSIEEITVYFKPFGVYIITGINNIGKSALARSMNAHFYNDVHQQYKKDFIRDGYDSFETESETYDGHIVEQKRGGCNSYQLTHPDGTQDDADFKLERGVPEKIRDVFNLYTDPVSKEKLNYRGSKANLMLVTTSPRETYDILQYAIKTTEINEGITNGNKSIKEAEKYLESRMDRIDALEGQLENIHVVDLEELEDSIEVLANLDTAVVALADASSIYSSVEVIDAKMAEYEDITGLFEQFETLKTAVASLRNIAKGYDKADTIETTITSNTSDLYNLSNYLEKLNTAALAKAYVAKSTKLEAINKKLDTNTIEIPAELRLYLEAIKHSNRIVETMQKYALNIAQTKEVQKEIADFDLQKTSLFKEHGYCPTCKTKFSGNSDLRSNAVGGEV